MSKTVADVRMHAATLFSLPPSIAADIVERLSTKDVCTLAKVCAFVTLTPHPVRWLTPAHRGVAGLTFRGHFCVVM